jgi:hypothetical protein
MMTPASHQFVDLKLREAAEAIEKAQSATAVKKGYVNFEMAARILYECRTAMDQETENDAMIGHLKTAVVALAAFKSKDFHSEARRLGQARIPLRRCGVAPIRSDRPRVDNYG